MCLVLLFGCSSNNGDKIIHKKALVIANNIDSSSLKLLRNYSYGRRGPQEFWSRESEGTAKYTFSLRNIGDTEELTLLRPFDFKKDFQTSFRFDTDYYYQYKFLKVRDSIVRIKTTGYDSQEFYMDSVMAVKNIFPLENPFTKIRKLNALKDDFGFVGTWYRGDIGDFLNFLLTPYDKLIYMPDTNRMNPKFKRVWIDEFFSGKEIKKDWRLVKVKPNT